MNLYYSSRVFNKKPDNFPDKGDGYCFSLQHVKDFSIACYPSGS